MCIDKVASAYAWVEFLLSSTCQRRQLWRYLSDMTLTCLFLQAGQTSKFLSSTYPDISLVKSRPDTSLSVHTSEYSSRSLSRHTINHVKPGHKFIMATAHSSSLELANSRTRMPSTFDHSRWTNNGIPLESTLG